MDAVAATREASLRDARLVPPFAFPLGPEAAPLIANAWPVAVGSLLMEPLFLLSLEPSGLARSRALRALPAPVASSDGIRDLQRSDT